MKRAWKGRKLIYPSLCEFGLNVCPSEGAKGIFFLSPAKRQSWRIMVIHPFNPYSNEVVSERNMKGLTAFNQRAGFDFDQNIYYSHNVFFYLLVLLLIPKKCDI